MPRLHDRVDERTDIYALGVILYEMLCGRAPFEAEGLGDVMLMHMSQAPQRPSELCGDLPPHVEQAVLCALAKRREDRFASMAELRSALGQSATQVVSVSGSMRVERESGRAIAVGGVSRDLPAGSSRPISKVARAVSTLALPELLEQPAAPLASNAAPARLAAEVVADGDDEDQITLRGGTGAGPSPPPVEYATQRETLGGSARRRTAWIGVLALALIGALALLFSPRGDERDPVHSATAAAARPPAPARDVAPTKVAAVTPEPAPAPLVAAAAQPEPADEPRRRAQATRSRESVRKRSQDQSEPQPQPQPQPQPPSATGAAEPRAEPSTAIESAGSLPVAPAAPAMPGPAGYLSLDSSPWAHVYLGSRLLGTTPLMRVSLPPGRHVLTLKNPEFGASTSYVVEIKAGDALSRMVGWDAK